MQDDTAEISIDFFFNGGMGIFSLRSILVEFVSLLYTLSLIM